MQTEFNLTILNKISFKLYSVSYKLRALKIIKCHEIVYFQAATW